MEKFIEFNGRVAPLDRANVDTDAIIPKQFMKSISRSGFGVNLFDEWRYLDPGEPGMDISQRNPNPQFVLNQVRFHDATALLTRENFGCGSSREHAVWALYDFGIRVIVAPSFADIFYVNCFKNGILPVQLASEDVAKLFEEIANADDYSFHVSLPSQQLTTSSGSLYRFEVDADRKRRLLEGLDDIAVTLKSRDAILDYEARRCSEEPWLFGHAAV
ncbi:MULTISPECIES: 3-isopropylmalate dehydratase small subunit [unclassified Burkholderia]|uniref:3-isopropylmalate dehydratase small subunit n=1 Tax=unclassified Burkholderia TaxID=2613784 RepID=UPI000F5AE5E6|nr:MULTISPECIES: 3-isopropylmalate dehydratase small subunit [unclassified Burkholderia]RQS19126.1 3-isopropylmalate dehydratase small subunit [Burkholderia sp. Bp8995]RQS38887.1 3-isopropylmalate dehydratase small subunit [Burkholderia sp. Bp8989]